MTRVEPIKCPETKKRICIYINSSIRNIEFQYLENICEYIPLLSPLTSLQSENVFFHYALHPTNDPHANIS